MRDSYGLYNRPVKAYAIFDGGGVKGAALAGCLKAAEEQKVKFVGFGGTSAGAIIALLAAVGYDGDELERILVKEFDFTQLLDDKGALLDELRSIPAKCRSKRGLFWATVVHRNLLRRVQDDFGLYHARAFRDFLLDKIKQKNPAFKNAEDVTFDDLKAKKLGPLKIMVSDIAHRKPVIFAASGEGDLTGSVLDAVRASMSYPFVFQPFRVGDGFMVDGGLSSNLPIFLFEKEREKDRLPVLAFDLIEPPRTTKTPPTFRSFCGDMLSTALASGDHVLAKTIRGVYHIPIPVPEGIDTLDFNLSVSDRERLFTKGLAETHSFFTKVLPQWGQAGSRVEWLQALHTQPRLIEPLLEAFRQDVETKTGARNLRANVMLPTPTQTLISAYQVGMQGDPDFQIELPIPHGCVGQCWATRTPTVADMVLSNQTLPLAERNRIKTDRKAVMSFPIFDIPVAPAPVGEMGLIGVLSVDTDNSLDSTGWQKSDTCTTIGKIWADIVSCVLR